MQINGSDLGNVAAGPYDWVTFDEPNGVLGLNLPNLPQAHAAVTGRYVFYNHSGLDGSDPAANVLDDNAIAAGKQALLPGQKATFVNYTSSDTGITGIIFDVSAATNAAGIGVDDVTVRVGTTSTMSSWSAAPQPTVNVRRGAGAGGADRVALTWPDNSIRNEWVQVTVKATADTGLSSPDVFYFGNLGGETGDATTTAIVTASDLSRTRAKLGTIVPADSPFDHRHDRHVNAAAVAAVRENLFQSLRLITAPAATTVSAAGDLGPVVPVNSRSAAPSRRRSTQYASSPAASSLAA
jgi:hypothetical protein